MSHSGKRHSLLCVHSGISAPTLVYGGNDSMEVLSAVVHLLQLPIHHPMKASLAMQQGKVLQHVYHLDVPYSRKGTAGKGKCP